MPQNPKKLAVSSQLRQADRALSLPEISELTAGSIPERTLRRWLVAWAESGEVIRTGKKRGTRYRFVASGTLKSKDDTTGMPHFLNFLHEPRRSAVLEQIRELWTHTSTALEGNTLSLGDTHAILGLGLTVSGKPLREHQEILGHANAIDLLYQSIQQPLDKALIFALHKAIQTDIVNDIYKPIGAWKVESNGTHAVTSNGEQVFIEYAHPLHVDALMDDLIQFINSVELSTITLKNAAHYYAKVHMAIAHIHPFWDGNGRMARLLANSLLLKAGLPPLVIEQSQRRAYIECLADYQDEAGQLTRTSRVWPCENALATFTEFCRQSYRLTIDLITRHQSKPPSA